ncbi:NAD(P)H-hydrate epimerase [Planctomicrobium sp. SH668]|uniref:NAD(P)H-hydrate epimerase n=1 Tax=Planctomicrobium sp. SH668 TaxID=3448126 RepID=UPI003F5C6E13
MPDHSPLSREQIRSVDQIAIREFGIPGLLLMENAGRGCSDLLLQKGADLQSPVVICCGKGNNGGDGFVMARHLDESLYRVVVLVFTPPESLSGDALFNYELLRRTNIPVHHIELPKDLGSMREQFAQAEWIVDALLGTGSRGAPREPYDFVIDEINKSGKRVFSVDLPSGLDCDSQDSPAKAIRATVTATLVAPKPAFHSNVVKPYLGDLYTLRIGIPRIVLSRTGKIPFNSEKDERK